MNDNEYWLKIFKYCTAAACVFVTLAFASCQHTKFQVVEMVKAGATPAQADCALSSGRDIAICAAVSAHHQPINSEEL